MPYVIGLVELVEQAGLRLTTNIVNCPLERLAIGMPLRVVFEILNDDVALPLFEPAEAVMSDKPERHAILSGVGQSAIGRRLFRTDLDLTCEAALAAIADAGLRPDDIDGIAAYPGPDRRAARVSPGRASTTCRSASGIDLRWHLSGAEGPAQISPIIHAMLAVAGGLCRHALVYRTVTEATAAADTGRLGIGAGSHEIRGFGAFLIPFGAMSAANWLALYARRHMYEFGTTRQHLGIIATTARRHAALQSARRSTASR